MIVRYPRRDDPLRQSSRLRARRLDEDRLVDCAIEASRARHGPAIVAGWGGTVSPSYRDQAFTECAVVCALSEDLVVMWGGRTSAKGTTAARVARECLQGTRIKTAPLFDRRYRAGTARRSTRRSIVAAARRAEAALQATLQAERVS